MAETTTYSTLVTAIQTYTEDDTSRLTGEIPAVIARAADRVQMDLDLTIFDQSVSANLAYGSASQTLPVSWLKVRNIYLSDIGVHLEQRSTQYLQQVGPNVIGLPKYWNGNDVSYTVAPIPDQNYRIVATTILRLASLSVANPTNYLTINTPTLLLYACLAEAERILVAPSQMQVWEATYAAELARQKNIQRSAARHDYSSLQGTDTAPQSTPSPQGNAQ